MLIELIDKIKKKHFNPRELISKFDTSSKQGFIFERLCDISIKFGYCKLFPNSVYKHVNSNVNRGKPKFITSIKKYINETMIFSRNASSCSDITLYDPKKDKYIFISCKYFANSDEKYDLQNINVNKEIYKNHEIYFFVNDKNKVNNNIDKFHILDMNNLIKYYKQMNKDFNKYSVDEYDEIFGFNKINLEMRFHQQIICNKMFKLINDGHKQILIGAKPRTGKTFICGGVIDQFKKNKPNFTVLIITPAPTETAPQFTEDLFNKYNEFNDCKIIHINNGKRAKILNKLLGKKNIIVVSKQLLQRYIDNDKLKNVLDDLKAQGKRIVFTNGCFDLLHAGHIYYLNKAKELGDIFVVAINSDASVKRLKGESRPLFSQQERAEILSALECVDYVCIFEEDTPFEIVNLLVPDILVKGGDYHLGNIVGRDRVEANGGEVITIPFLENKSTTNIIEKVLKSASF